MKFEIRKVIGIVILVIIAVFAVIIPVLRHAKEAETAGTEITYDLSQETAAPTSTDAALPTQPEPTRDLAWDWPDSHDGEIEVDPASATDITE